MKTKKSASKRFKVRGSGSIKRGSAKIVGSHRRSPYVVVQALFDAFNRLIARMRDAIAATSIDHGNETIALSVSIGVATYPEDGHNIDSLLARADRAMYMAKQGGRNGVVKFTI